LPLLLLAGVLDSRRWMTEMIRLVHSWGLDDPIHKSLKRTMDKGNKEGGKSLDVGGKRDGRLLPIPYTSIADI